MSRTDGCWFLEARIFRGNGIVGDEKERGGDVADVEEKRGLEL